MIERIKQDKISIIFLFLGLFLIIFICITLGDMFYKQIKDFSTLISTAKDSVVLKAILISISASALSTIISFFFGVPLAYFLARKNFIGKSIVEGIVDIPLIIPHIVAGIALYGVFMRTGLLGAPFGKVGVKFVDAFPGIIVAMLFMSLPYLVDTAREGFKAVDPRLENVSRSLGASQWRSFREITFPLASSSIFSGCILCWARGISEFSAVLVLAYFPRSAPILIYERFTSYGLSNSRPISVLLISICLFIFILLRIFKRRREQ
ncbi:MAG TPA: ABC transporter permease subunit [Thermoplasmata archaeon]|nr:ABC transporter permease subunit [Thermoplasmata archaeon]